MWAGGEDEYQPDNAETHISYTVIWTVSHLQKINNIFSELTGNLKFPTFPMWSRADENSEHAHLRKKEEMLASLCFCRTNSGIVSFFIDFPAEIRRKFDKIE